MPTQPTGNLAVTQTRSTSRRAAAKPGKRPPGRLRRYELFCTDGSLRLRLQLTDEGVTPGVDGMDFMLNRRWTRRAYREIVAITLSTSGLPDSSIIGVCRIVFTDGMALLVSSVNANGLSDGVRNSEFNAFVADLHRRLMAAGEEGIAFRSGYGRIRSIALVLSLLAAIMLFIALPIALALLDGRPIWLLTLPFAALLVLPGARLAHANLGGRYRPNRPPTLL